MISNDTIPCGCVSKFSRHMSGFLNHFWLNFCHKSYVKVVIGNDLVYLVEAQLDNVLHIVDCILRLTSIVFFNLIYVQYKTSGKQSQKSLATLSLYEKFYLMPRGYFIAQPYSLRIYESRK